MADNVNNSSFTSTGVNTSTTAAQTLKMQSISAHELALQSEQKRKETLVDLLDRKAKVDDLKNQLAIEQGKLKVFFEQKTPKAESARSRYPSTTANIPDFAIDKSRTQDTQTSELQALRDQTFFDQLGVDRDASQELARDLQTGSEALRSVAYNISSNSPDYDEVEHLRSKVEMYRVLNAVHEVAQERANRSLILKNSPTVSLNISTPTQTLSQQEEQRKEQERARLAQQLEQARRIANEALARLIQENRRLEEIRKLDEQRRLQHEKEQNIKQAQKDAHNPTNIQQLQARGLANIDPATAATISALAQKKQQEVLKEQQKAASQMAAAHGVPVPPGTQNQITFEDPRQVDPDGNKGINPDFQVVHAGLNADSKAALGGDHLTSSARAAHTKAGARVGAPSATGMETNPGLAGADVSTNASISAKTYAHDMDEPGRRHEIPFGPKK